jgi:hypothetical protein
MLTANDMQPGDLIEFVSDKQTDKGPCSGRCISNDGVNVTLKYSDIVSIYRIEELIVNYCTNRTKFNNAFWALA